MENKAVVIFRIHKKKEEYDLEIPLDISANELVNALNSAFDLGIDTSNVKNCYFQAENPVALLKGNKLLSDYGIRNGSIVNFTE